METETTKDVVKLVSFHGDPAVKQKYIDRMKAHMVQDELVQGIGFDPQTHKGCAVGCTLDKYSHTGFEDELGIPTLIAVLEDNIFEALPWEEAKDFPLQFLEAVPIGKDLDNVWRKFFIWQLLESDPEVFNRLTEEDKKISTDFAALLQKGIDGIAVTSEEWENVRDRAYLAYRAYRADLAYRAIPMRDKLLQLLKEA